MSAASFRDLANFIWGVADLIRDSFKRGKYQDVILPLTVLRRIDCVLEPTKAKVFEVNKKLTGKLENRDPQLRRASASRSTTRPGTTSSASWLMLRASPQT
jgi:type I restriction enzyme M protein